jgi:hypothetical protein
LTEDDLFSALASGSGTFFDATDPSSVSYISRAVVIGLLLTMISKWLVSFFPGPIG